MNITIRIAGLVAAVALAGPAMAQDRGFYVGGDLGQGSTELDRDGLDSAFVSAIQGQGLSVLSGSSTTSEDAFSWSLALGYRVLPYLAVEASYFDFGKGDYRGNALVTDGVTQQTANLHVEGRARGPALSALGILPWGPWSVYGRVGVFFADVDYDLTSGTNGISLATAEAGDHSESFLWGIGAGYSNDRWTTRLEYQAADDVDDGDTSVSRIVIGAIYHF